SRQSPEAYGLLLTGSYVIPLIHEARLVMTNMNLSFPVHIHNQMTELYFETHADDSPVKIGDGSFGTVYSVYNESHDRFAAKIIYEARQIYPITKEHLVDEVISNFLVFFNIKPEEPIVKHLAVIKDSSDIIKAIDGLDLTHEQFRYIVGQVNNNIRLSS